jgi:hypothetical protein
MSLQGWVTRSFIKIQQNPKRIKLKDKRDKFIYIIILLLLLLLTPQFSGTHWKLIVIHLVKKVLRLCNSKVHYRGHNSPPWVPVSLMNPVHTLHPGYLRSFYFPPLIYI